MSNQPFPNIYQYNNYRLFLRDWFSAQRASTPDFSLRAFAAKAGLSSHSFCSAIVNGRRDLTARAIRKFVTGLELEDNRAEYFRALVMFCQEKDIAGKDRLFAKVNSLRKNSSFFRLNKDHFAYFSHWSFFVIRELAAIAQWNRDYARLGKMVRPPVSAAAARKAVKTLVRIGMLVRQPDGTYTQPTAAVSTQSIPGHLVRKIRAQFIELSKSASEKIDPSERNLGSATIPLTQENYNQAEIILEEARKRLFELSNAQPSADRIYQVNLHIFPVSEPLNGTTSGPTKSEEQS